MDPAQYKAYREAFDSFDCHSNGRIAYASLQVGSGSVAELDDYVAGSNEESWTESYGC